ncbi:hypothetical protein H9P43_001463 [Blastocladiella emersonii ATCC 22665]|nr:hypothetical protein H9P43_001463 [Blastocladiella emersonii ATCC 22665]
MLSSHHPADDLPPTATVLGATDTSIAFEVPLASPASPSKAPPAHLAGRLAGKPPASPLHQILDDFQHAVDRHHEFVERERERVAQHDRKVLAVQDRQRLATEQKAQELEASLTAAADRAREYLAQRVGRLHAHNVAIDETRAHKRDLDAAHDEHSRAEHQAHLGRVAAAEQRHRELETRRLLQLSQYTHVRQDLATQRRARRTSAEIAAAGSRTPSPTAQPPQQQQAQVQSEQQQQPAAPIAKSAEAGDRPGRRTSVAEE